MSTKHTPTPWLQEGVMVWNKERGTVAKCSTANSPSEAEANAEFIVRACNSHAELLAACKKARSIVSVVRCEHPSKTMDDAYQQIEAAVANAEGAA